MAKFTDGKGNDWEIRFTVGDVERVKEDADFDFDELIQKPDAVSATIFQSPKKFAQILWVLCEEQARERKIDPRTFGRFLDRETIDKATDAVVEAALLFYPRSSAGRAIKGRLPEMLRRMDADIEAKVNEQIERTLSGTATVSPVSVASIPGG